MRRGVITLSEVVRAIAGRLQRLERRGPPGGAEGRTPSVEVWVPDKGRDGRTPGRYPCPGSNAVLVIYQADESAPGEADA